MEFDSANFIIDHIPAEKMNNHSYELQWKIKNITKDTIFCPDYITVFRDGMIEGHNKPLLPGKTRIVSIMLYAYVYDYELLFWKMGYVEAYTRDTSGIKVFEKYYMQIKCSFCPAIEPH